MFDLILRNKTKNINSMQMSMVQCVWSDADCSCISIKFLCEHLSMKWVLGHQLLFIKALLFVIMDLTGEV